MSGCILPEIDTLNSDNKRLVNYEPVRVYSGWADSRMTEMTLNDHFSNEHGDAP